MQTASPIVLLSTWISRLAWLNLCWMLFSLLGLLVAGVFPATTVVLQMIRRYLDGATRVSLKDFYREWRRELVRSNLSAWPLALVLFSLGWYLGKGLDAGSQLWQMLSLALVPLILLMAMGLLALLLQNSVYRANIAGSWANAAVLLQQLPGTLLAGVMAILGCLLLCALMPILAPIWSFMPALLMSMALYLRHYPEIMEFNNK